MGHGKGSGQGECGCCQPCGICGIPLKTAAFIWAIVHIVWGGLWVLLILSDLSWYLEPVNPGHSSHGDGENWAYWVIYLALAGFWLALGIILMLGVRCSTNICKVNFYLWGCIICLGIAFLLGIVWRARLGRYGGSGYGGGHGTFIVFVTCFWWWYPYWCIYAYYIELGGKSWCACEGCK